MIDMDGVKKDMLVLVGRNDGLVVSGFSNKDSAGNDNDDAIADEIVAFFRKNICSRLYNKLADKMAVRD